MEFDSTVEWGSNDFVELEKLQAMVNNSNYLYRRVVKWGFRGLEQVPVQDSTNLKLLAGVTIMGGEDRTLQSRDVSFGDFFSATCDPIVTATLVTQDRQRSFVVLQGLDGSNNISRSGMRIWLSYQEGIDLTFQREQRIHWHAMGW